MRDYSYKFNGGLQKMIFPILIFASTAAYADKNVLWIEDKLIPESNTCTECVGGSNCYSMSLRIRESGQNDTLARDCLLMSVYRGYPLGYHDAAKMHIYGDLGVEQDIDKGLSYYKKLCAYGDDIACHENEKWNTCKSKGDWPGLDVINCVTKYSK